MNKLPMSWCAIPLGQEVEFKKGKKPEFLHGMPNEDLVPYVDIKAFEKGNIRQYADQSSGVIAEANDTLMVWDGARSGLVGNGIAGVIGSTLMRIRPKSSNRNYLHKFLKYKFNQINSNTKGTGIPHVSPEFLFGIDIPLAPLSEQKRIADKLDAVLARVDACRDRLDRIPAILKRFRQSVLAAATSGKLTEEWRADQVARMQPQAESGNIVRDSAQSRYAVTSTPDSATLHPGYEVDFDQKNALPASWREVTFADVCREITVGYVGKMSDQYLETGVPFLRSMNVRAFRFDQKGLLYISPEFHKKNFKSVLQPGDLAIVRTGAPGICCVIPEDISEANCSDLVIARPGSELLSQYGCIFMNSTFAADFVKANKVGVAQAHFNVGSMKVTPLPLPPIVEQTEIVRRVEALFAYADRFETRHKAARAQVEKLTPAALAKAFRGELVPQDPNDEPASVLLARIHAQRNDPRVGKPSRSRRRQ